MRRRKVPIANPRVDAIVEGVFGFDTRGGIRPTRNQVRAITEDRARELVGILECMRALISAQENGIDPRTGKRPHTKKSTESLRNFLRDELPKTRANYVGRLDAYERGFGSEAALSLDRWCKETALKDVGT